MPEDKLARPRGAHPLRVWIAGGCAALVLALFVISWSIPPVLQKLAVIGTSKVHADLMGLERALEDYAQANAGRYPKSLQELVTPDANGNTYVKGTRIPLDPWGNDYLYALPSSEGGLPIVYTFGRDGRRGGKGDDADIDNLSTRLHR